MVHAMGTSEDGTTPEGPYLLRCPYCNWSSSELGIEFHKPNNITGQLANLKKWGTTREQSSQQQTSSQETEEDSGRPDHERQFANLKSFYASQLAEPSAAGSSLDFSSSYGSPGTLSRIMGLYTGVSSYGAKKPRGKSSQMREGHTEAEGMLELGSEEVILSKTQEAGWDGSEQPRSESWM